MRNARKWLSVLLALAFACLPQMTLPAQAAEVFTDQQLHFLPSFLSFDRSRPAFRLPV